MRRRSFDRARAWRRWPAAVALIAAPYAASAQSQAGASSETGSLITKRPASAYGSSKTDARRTTRQFGECTLSRSPGAVAKLLAEPVDGPNYVKLMKSVVTDDCLGDGELSFSYSLLRASLFQASYDREFGRAGPIDFTAVPPVDYRGRYPKTLTDESANAIALAQFGDCVGRSDGVNARALLLSLAGTKGEDAAVSALLPKLAPCVPPGRKITFSRSVLRGAIAEGMYRLSRAKSGMY